MDRRIRKTKRELQNLQNAIDKETDPVIKERFEKQFERKSALLKKQNEAYNDFCEETGQSRLPDRINIAKWQRSETAKRSIKAAKDYEKRVENSNRGDILKLSTKYLNKNDSLYEYSKNIKPIPEFEDIVTHGDPISLIFKNADGTESNVSAEEFVGILKQDPNYTGGNIRLIACQTAANGGMVPKYIAKKWTSQ